MKRDPYVLIAAVAIVAFGIGLIADSANAQSGTPRAQQVYSQSWELTKHLFPPRAAAPPARFLTADERYPKPNPRAAMWIDTTTRIVFIAPGQTRALASPYIPTRRAAQKRLLHEWRHVHQSTALLNDPDLSKRELDASQFARRYAYLFRPRTP